MEQEVKDYKFENYFLSGLKIGVLAIFVRDMRVCRDNYDLNVIVSDIEDIFEEKN